MKKIKKNVLGTIALTIALPTMATPNVEVTSIIDSSNARQANTLIKWVDDNNIAFFSSLSGGSALDLSLMNLSTEEIVDLAIADGLIDVSIFGDYPNLPTDEAALTTLSGYMGIENPTQADFISWTSKAMSIAVFVPMLNRKEGIRFVGQSDTQTFLAEDDATNTDLFDIYRCETSTLSLEENPSLQTESCNELLSDIIKGPGTVTETLRVNKYGSIAIPSHSSDNNVPNRYYAVVNGVTYTIDSAINNENNMSVIPGSNPIIVSGISFSSNYEVIDTQEVFYLHNDGFAEQLSLIGFDNTYSINMNDTYMVITTVPAEGMTSISACQYIINSAYLGNNTESSGDLGGTISCKEGTLKILDLSMQNIPTYGSIEAYSGYMPYIAMGYYNEFAIKFAPGNDQPFTTALYDLESDEISFISNSKLESLANIYGSGFINTLQDSILGNLSTTYPQVPNDPVASGYSEDITQDEYVAAITEKTTWLATQPTAYANYLETGQAPTEGLTTDTDSTAQAFVLLLSPMYFHDENTLMTPDAKYIFTRPVNTGTLRARVALPNNEAPVGAIATVQASDGTLTTKTADANGVFAFANLPVGNYTVQISYSKHVASCLTAEITADNTNNMGVIVMLAGDLDGNGTIANQDVWRFNARANYPTEDFDVNNDGAVNVSDKNMIMNNIGATQCQL